MGEAAIGRQGGRGGAGGKGGAGGTGDPMGVGGGGGLGGAGGQGARGEPGPPGERGPAAAWLRWTLVAWMVVFSVLVAYSWQVQRDQVRRNLKQAQQTNAVLCVFRGDLQNRVKSNLVLLANPGNFGLTQEAQIVLRTTTISEQATIASLGGLKCP